MAKNPKVNEPKVKRRFTKRSLHPPVPPIIFETLRNIRDPDTGRNIIDSECVCGLRMNGERYLEVDLTPPLASYASRGVLDGLIAEIEGKLWEAGFDSAIHVKYKVKKEILSLVGLGLIATAIFVSSPAATAYITGPAGPTGTVFAAGGADVFWSLVAAVIGTILLVAAALRPKELYLSSEHVKD